MIAVILQPSEGHDDGIDLIVEQPIHQPAAMRSYDGDRIPFTAILEKPPTTTPAGEPCWWRQTKSIGRCKRQHELPTSIYRTGVMTSSGRFSDQDTPNWAVKPASVVGPTQLGDVRILVTSRLLQLESQLKSILMYPLYG